jgi:hypothetical protein
MDKLGLTPHHRRSFAPVKELASKIKEFAA